MKTSHEGNYGEIITRRKTSYHRRPAWPSSPWSWSPRTWPGRGSFGWCSTWAGLALPFFLELNFLNWTGFLVSFIVSKINLNLILRCFWFWCETCFGNVEKLKSFDSDTLPRYFSVATKFCWLLLRSPLRFRYGLVVRISGSHPGGPGSIPGNGKFF